MLCGFASRASHPPLLDHGLSMYQFNSRRMSLNKRLLLQCDRRGRQLVLARGDLSCPMALDMSVHSGRSISRVPGIVVYLSEHAFGLPSGFVHVLKTVGVVHHTVIFLTVQKVRLQLELPTSYKIISLPSESHTRNSISSCSAQVFWTTDWTTSALCIVLCKVSW